MQGRLVGLVGKARAGKDTVAAGLGEVGWQRLAFADQVRAVLELMDPMVGHGLDCEPLSAALAWWGGWEGIKGAPGVGVEIRGLLQRLGDGNRRIDPDVWWRPVLADAARLRSTGVDVVISDVRYRNEAEAIRAAGGTLVRVLRPGAVYDDLHVSEVELDNFPCDHVIFNESDLAHMRSESHILHDLL